MGFPTRSNLVRLRIVLCYVSCLTLRLPHPQIRLRMHSTMKEAVISINGRLPDCSTQSHHSPYKMRLQQMGLKPTRADQLIKWSENKLAKSSLILWDCKSTLIQLNYDLNQQNEWCSTHGITSRAHCLSWLFQAKKTRQMCCHIVDIQRYCGISKLIAEKTWPHQIHPA